MYDSILVPLDGSEVASSILPYVTNLAKRLDSRVTLLTALSPSTLSPDSHTEAWEEAHAILQQQERRLTLDGVKADSLVVAGEAAEQIVKQVEERHFDLIAIGTRGHSGLRRGLLGSVTDEVIRSSPAPALVLSPRAVERSAEQGHGLSSITVPLDGSDLAESILPRVEGLTRHLSLKMNLVRVVTLPPLAYYAGEGVASDTTPIEEDLENEAAAYLKGVAEGLAKKGIASTSVVLRGSPALAIIDYAKEISNNLVAISSHGRAGLERMLIGSVADSVIRSAGVPTLVMAPHES